MATPTSQFPAPWPAPIGGDHPRLYVSNRHGGTSNFLNPNVAALVTRINGSHSASWGRLQSWASSVTGNPQSYFTSRNGEFTGALAFSRLLAQNSTTESHLQKAITVAINWANAGIPSAMSEQRSRVGALAMVYDWAYSRLSSSQRTTLRNAIAGQVQAYRNRFVGAGSKEYPWGTVHGDVSHGTPALMVILEDGTSSENNTWMQWMDEFQNARDPGVLNPQIGFFPVFRHFGNQDGGTHKGCGPQGYDTSQEDFYHRVFAALRTGINLDLYTLEAWYRLMAHWKLWHQRSDRTFHHQAENRVTIRYSSFTEVHLYQAAAALGPSTDAEHFNWLANVEISTISAAFNMWEILFWRNSIPSVQPTIARVGGNQMRFFSQAGKLCFREGWTSTSTTFTIGAQRHFTGGHSDRDAGHFELASDGAPLFISPGHYDSAQDDTWKLDTNTSTANGAPTGHRYTYRRSGPACSGVRVMDSNEPTENRVKSYQLTGSADSAFGHKVTASSSITISNNGWHMWPKAADGDFQPDNLSEILNEPDWNFQPFPITPQEFSSHCYAVFDLTGYYYPPKVRPSPTTQGFVRLHVVWVKAGQIPGWSRPCILLFWDCLTHLDATAGVETQVLQLQTLVNPTGTATSRTITRNNARCFVRTLSPTSVNHRVVVGYQDVAGTLYPGTDIGSQDDSGTNPNGTGTPGAYRMEWWGTTASTQRRFVTALFPCASSVGSPPTTSLFEDATWIGATIAGIQVKVRKDTAYASFVGTPSSDTTPPPAPTNLTGVAGDAQIVLDWDDSPASDFQDFRIYRRILDGATWGPFTLIATQAPSSYTDSAVTNGITYSYQVTARDASLNESVGSNITGPLTPTAPQPPDTTPPAMPTGLTAIAGNGQVAIDWNDNGEADLGSYRLYRQQKSGTVYLAETLVGSPTTSSLTDTTVTNGQTYHYRVSAVDIAGNESARTAYTPDVTPALPPAPAAPTGLVATAGDANVVLDWNDNVEADLASYKVYRELKVGGVFQTEQTIATGLTLSAYTDLSVVNDQTYRYRVGAVNTTASESPRSVYSAEVTPAPPPPPPDTTPPAVPTSLIGTAGDALVVLDWADQSESDLAGFFVYREVFSGGAFGGELRIATATVSGHSDTSVTNDITYRYRVSAFDASGNESQKSAFTAGLTPTGPPPPPDPTPPAAPTGLAATAGDAQVVLDWNDNGEIDFSYYKVYRETLVGGAFQPEVQIANLLTASSYTDLAVVNGTTYRYRVGAVDEDDEESARSLYSAEVRPQAPPPPPDTTPPAVPSNLTATAGDNLVSLNWDDNVESDLAGYRVYRGELVGGSFSADIRIATVSASAFADATAVNGTTYRYAVSAIDNALTPNESAKTAYTADQTPAGAPPPPSPPAAPTGVSAVAGNAVVTVDWDDNGESDFSHYRLFRERFISGAWEAEVEIQSALTVSSYTDTAVQNGLTYRYRVRAVDAELEVSGYSAYSQEVTPQNVPPPDLTPPAMPTGLVGVAGDAQVALDWGDNAESDLVGYRVYRQEKVGGVFGADLRIASPAASSYTDSTAANGATYRYRVTAIDSATPPNESPATSYTGELTPVDPTPPDTTPPPTPTSLVGIGGDGQVSLDWECS